MRDKNGENPMDTTDDTVGTNEGTITTTPAIVSNPTLPVLPVIMDLPGSDNRLKEIVYKFQQQIQRIEELEHRIDERVTRSRRRISSLLEHQAPITRSSHLRLFVSHSYTKPKPQIQQPTPPLFSILDIGCGPGRDTK